MRSTKVAQQTWQNILRDGGRCAQSECATLCTAERGKGMPGLMQQSARLNGIFEKGRSGRRKTDPGAGAIEESNSQIRLKRLDLQADRRLSQV